MQMTTEDMKTAVKTRKPAVVIGGAIGLLLVGGWFGFDAIMTPAVPVAQSAGADEVVGFVIDPRGLVRMADIEQQQFLLHWKESLSNETRQTELKSALQSLSDERRKKFSDVIFKHLKRSFMNDAAQFSQLSTQSEKSEFCRKRVDEFAAQSAFMKEISVVFKNDFPGPDGFQEWVLRHTSIAERQLGEPYVEALKRVSTQMKKESRADATKSG